MVVFLKTQKGTRGNENKTVCLQKDFNAKAQGYKVLNYAKEKLIIVKNHLQVN